MDKRTQLKSWFVFWILAAAYIAILFAIYSYTHGPGVDPPKNMKTADPYWYSGK